MSPYAKSRKFVECERTVPTGVTRSLALEGQKGVVKENKDMDLSGLVKKIRDIT